MVESGGSYLPFFFFIYLILKLALIEIKSCFPSPLVILICNFLILKDNVFFTLGLGMEINYHDKMFCFL